MSRTKNKMVIVMRKDLKMTKGKYVAQGSHACLGLVLDIQKSDNEQNLHILNEWLFDSFTKVGLSVNSEEELLSIYQQALDANLPTTLITDNGWTMFNEVPTNTCIAILGRSEDINKITGHLKLL